MITKQEMIAIIKAENPTLQVGSDEQGYTQLSPIEYEATISQWSDNRLTKEAKAAEAAQAATDKAAVIAKLGISADEAKLLLS